MPERGKITRRTLQDLGDFWSNKGRFVFNEFPLLKKEKYKGGRAVEGRDGEND